MSKLGSDRSRFSNLPITLFDFLENAVKPKKSPGTYFQENQNKKGGVHPIEGFLDDTRQRPEHNSLAQQGHVDRLHRYTIQTTSASIVHANGPTARGNRYLSQLVVGTGATSGVELRRRRYNPQKGDECYFSTDRLRMCTMYQ